jgi:hypothetical protein
MGGQDQVPTGPIVEAHSDLLYPMHWLVLRGPLRGRRPERAKRGRERLDHLIAQGHHSGRYDLTS